MTAARVAAEGVHLEHVHEIADAETGAALVLIDADGEKMRLK